MLSLCHCDNAASPASVDTRYRPHRDSRCRRRRMRLMDNTGRHRRSIHWGHRPCLQPHDTGSPSDAPSHKRAAMQPYVKLLRPLAVIATTPWHMPQYSPRLWAEMSARTSSLCRCCKPTTHCNKSFDPAGLLEKSLLHQKCHPVFQHPAN